MFKTDPQRLLLEIEASEDRRRSELEVLSDMKKHYRGGGSSTKDLNDEWPENHYYEYLGLTTSKIIYHNPRVRASSRRGGEASQVAEALHYGLNRWCVDYDLRKKLIALYTDQCFCYGIALTSVGPRPGARRHPSSPHWPSVKRISPTRFFMDPKALSFDECRFQGHRWVMDKDDLIKKAEREKNAGWNMEALKNLSSDIEVDEISRDPDSVRDGLLRHEIVGYEVWVPEYTEEGWPSPKEGFHGGIFTLAVAQHNGEKKADYVKAPRPAYVPRWGPYTLFGAYHNPDSVWPVSPFKAIFTQLRDLNDIVRAANESGKRYKRIVLYDSRNADLGAKLKKSEHDFVIPINGLMDLTGTPMFQTTELAGVTDQLLTQIRVAMDRLDRNSGTTESQRGAVTGVGTATENAIADDASTRRLDIPKQNFGDGVKNILRTAGYYMYHDDRIVFPLDQEAGAAMGQESPWFHGGDHDPESGYTFDDIELELEPYSMEKTGEAFLQQQVMGVVQTMTAIRDLVLTSPPGSVDAKPLLALAGQAHNFSDASKVFNLEVLSEAQPDQAQSGDQGPRLSKSVKNTSGEPKNKSSTGGGGTLGGMSGGKMGKTNGQAMGRALQIESGGANG